jgi:hypothetical protein
MVSCNRHRYHVGWGVLGGYGLVKFSFFHGPADQAIRRTLQFSTTRSQSRFSFIISIIPDVRRSSSESRVRVRVARVLKKRPSFLVSKRGFRRIRSGSLLTLMGDKSTHRQGSALFKRQVFGSHARLITAGKDGEQPAKQGSFVLGNGCNEF